MMTERFTPFDSVCGPLFGLAVSRLNAVSNAMPQSIMWSSGGESAAEPIATWLPADAEGSAVPCTHESAGSAGSSSDNISNDPFNLMPTFSASTMVGTAGGVAAGSQPNEEKEAGDAPTDAPSVAVADAPASATASTAAVHVHTLCRGIVKFSASTMAGTTVLQLKAILHNKLHVPGEDIRIIARGCELSDEALVLDDEDAAAENSSDNDAVVKLSMVLKSKSASEAAGAGVGAAPLDAQQIHQIRQRAEGKGLTLELLEDLLQLLADGPQHQ